MHFKATEKLLGKVCLITGGSAGIGRATAMKFAYEGAQVIISDINEMAGRSLATLIGNKAVFYTVDVADQNSVQQWIQAVVKRFERIDVLVNNAGITRDAQLVKIKDGNLVGKMSTLDFENVIDVNLKGVFHCTQAVVPIMIGQKQGGVILNASSIVGIDGNFGQTNYAASKAGVIGMTKVWARELGRYGIRVNAVAPGFIETAMTSKIPEKIKQQAQKHIPLGRLGDVTDIANAYAFLASDEASYITGAVLRVDGGRVNGT